MTWVKDLGGLPEIKVARVKVHRKKATIMKIMRTMTIFSIEASMIDQSNASPNNQLISLILGSSVESLKDCVFHNYRLKYFMINL